MKSAGYGYDTHLLPQSVKCLKHQPIIGPDTLHARRRFRSPPAPPASPSFRASLYPSHPGELPCSHHCHAFILNQRSSEGREPPGPTSIVKGWGRLPLLAPKPAALAGPRACRQGSDGELDTQSRKSKSALSSRLAYGKYVSANGAALVLMVLPVTLSPPSLPPSLPRPDDEYTAADNVPRVWT